MPKSFGCLVLAICAVLLASCGGGSGGTDSVPPPPEPPLPVTYEISVTSSPASSAVRVGQTAEATLSWRFTSTATNPTSTSYSVTTTTAGVQITGGAGSSLPNTEITTSLRYECSSIETVQALLLVSVGGTTREISWEINCTGQRITVEPIEPSIVSLGFEAQSSLTWSYSSVGEARAELPYTVTSSAESISVEPGEGSALPDSEITIDLGYSCKTPGDFVLELTTSVGTATEVSSWSVTCTVETITIENPPHNMTVSIGEEANSQLTWHYSSTSVVPRQLTYSVRSDVGTVTISDASDRALPQTTVSHHLGYRCEAPGEVEIGLAIEIGSTSQTIKWVVECTSETIEILTPPLASYVSIGESDSPELVWRLHSSGDSDRTFSYVVVANHEAIQIVGGEGVITPGDEVSTRFNYVCESPEIIQIDIVINVGNTTAMTTWDLVCSEETVVIEQPLSPRSVSVGSQAHADFNWRIETTGTQTRVFSYMIVSPNQRLEIEPNSGQVGPGASMETNVTYTCVESGQVEIAITIEVGNASQATTWVVECTNETIEILTAALASYISIGESVSSDLVWRLHSSGKSDRVFDYLVEVDHMAVQVMVGEGVTMPEDEISTQFSYVCESPENVQVNIVITAGNATETSTWHLVCSEETVVVEQPLPLSSVSVGSQVIADFDWRIETTGIQSRVFSFVIETQNQQLRVEPESGQVVPGTPIKTQATYTCVESGQIEVAMSIRVGSAAKQFVWRVECTQEQVEIVLPPPDLTVASIGKSAMIEVRWLLRSTATLERSFPFRVDTRTPGIQAAPTSGLVNMDQDVTTNVEFECREVGKTDAIIVIRVGNAARELPWSVECSQESVTIVENPQPVSVSVGKKAKSAFRWYVATSSMALDEIEFSIQPNRDEVIVAKSTGQIAPNENVETSIMFVCEAQVDLTLEISIEVGSATKLVSWDVECSQESIEFVSAPFPETVLAVGETATVELSWVLTSSAQTSREFSYEVSAATSSAQISNSTGETAPSRPTTHEVAYTCDQGGEIDIVLSVTAGSDRANTSWRVVCILDTIAIVSAPEAMRVPVGDSVIGSLEWQFRSSYPGREVSFEISSATRGLQIQNSEGTVRAGNTIKSRLRYACTARRSVTVALHIKAGGAERDLSWSIECFGEDLTQFELLFFQGPQIGSFRFESEADGWSSSLIAQSDIEPQEPLRFRTNRQVFVEIRTEHDELMPLPIALRLIVDSHDFEIDQIGETDTKVIEGESEYKYVSRFLFDISVDSFKSPNVLEILIDPESRYPEFDETNNRALFRFDAGNTLDLPKLNVTFVPIRTLDGVPDLSDIDSFVQPLYELMPVGTIDASIDEELDASDLSWTLDSSREILDRLHDRYLSALDSDSYYQGIVRRPEEQEVNLCGNAFLDGTVSITVEQCSKHIGAHELGHNFNLKHAPACGAEDTNVDPNYPYPEGDIGRETGWLMLQKQFIDGTAPKEFVQLDYRYYDVMSYCPETFTSQYSYGKALSYLHRKYGVSASRQIGEPLASEFDRVPGRSLFISGSVSPDSHWMFRRIELMNLDPLRAFPMPTNYSIVVVHGGSGTVLYREPLEVLRPAHADDGRLSWGARIPYFGSDGLQLNIVDQSDHAVLHLDLSAYLTDSIP